MLQAWIDVIEQADLSLQRVDWLVSCAQRCLHHLSSDWTGVVAWLFTHASAVRLVLIRNGVPEVDQTFATDGICTGRSDRSDSRSVSAWQTLTNRSCSTGLVVLLPESQQQIFFHLIDAARQDCLLNQALEWNPAPWGDDSGNDPLEPLEQLALLGC